MRRGLLLYFHFRIGVRVGEYDKSTDRDCLKKFCNDPIQDIAIEERIPHPDFQRNTYENDIGLLRVTPIKFNESEYSFILFFLL